MYKNLAATLVAACFFSPVFSQTRQGRPLKVGFVYVTPVTDAGWVHQHDDGRKAVEAALGRQGEDHLRRERRRRPRCRARDPRPGAAGPQADLHAQLRLHGAHAEGGEGLPGREVRIHHRLQDGAQRRHRQRPLLRGPLPGRRRGGPHDQDPRGGLCRGLPDSRGAAGHQCLHARHALGGPEGAGQGRVAQRLVRSAARSAKPPWRCSTRTST